MEEPSAGRRMSRGCIGFRRVHLLGLVLLFFFWDGGQDTPTQMAKTKRQTSPRCWSVSGVGQMQGSLPHCGQKRMSSSPRGSSFLHSGQGEEESNSSQSKKPFGQVSPFGLAFSAPSTRTLMASCRWRKKPFLRWGSWQRGKEGNYPIRVCLFGGDPSCCGCPFGFPLKPAKRSGKSSKQRRAAHMLDSLAPPLGIWQLGTLGVLD